jgi:hypothetical protein
VADNMILTMGKRCNGNVVLWVDVVP